MPCAPTQALQQGHCTKQLGVTVHLASIATQIQGQENRNPPGTLKSPFFKPDHCNHLKKDQRFTPFRTLSHGCLLSSAGDL